MGTVRYMWHYLKCRGEVCKQLCSIRNRLSFITLPVPHSNTKADLKNNKFIIIIVVVVVFGKT
jgi:hypothetical protein